MTENKKPYVGPSPIQANQPFYGREIELNELIDRLVARRIVLLHSPSGAGKTSLIQAGLLPEMSDLGYHIFRRALVSRQPAAGQVPKDLVYNSYCLSVLMLLDEGLPKKEQTPIAELAQMKLIDYLESHLERHAQGENEDGAARCLLVFDQFEEILTLNPADQQGRLGFFAELMQVLYDYRFWALFAMREDYIAGLEPYLSYYPERMSARFRLEFLGPEQALRAIQNPARDFGANFHDDAAAQLVKDLRQVYVQNRQGVIEKQDGPYIEPVQLQVVCANLWDSPRSQRNQITLQDVQTYGNVDNALASYYATRVKEAAEAGDIPESNLRFWIDERLLTPQGLRRQVLSGPDPEYSINETAVRRLVDAYILREEQRRGAGWLELAHDRLVEPVRKDNADWFERHLSLLQRRAIQWERERRPDNLLLHDQALSEAEDWAKDWTGRGLALTRSEQDLLKISQDARQQQEEDRRAQARAERQDLELKAAQEKAELQAKAARRQRLFLAGISVLALVALVLLMITFLSLRTTQTERGTAVARLTALAAADSTSTSVANQSTVVANLRQTSDAATAQANSLQQVAQVANEVAQSMSTESPITTSAPGATEPVLIPVTGGGGYPYDNLFAAADRLKDSQPRLALGLSAVAYDLSGSNPQAANSIYKLVNDLAPAGFVPAQTIADMGAPVIDISISPDSAYVLANSNTGDIVALTLDAEFNPAAAVRGVPNSSLNTFYDSDLQPLALVGPQAEGLSIAGSEVDSINWEEIAKTQRTFAALQVGPTSLADQNRIGQSNKFPPNWSGMIGDPRFLDMVRGAYWQFEPGMDPVKQAGEFYNIVTDARFGSARKYGQPGDLPLILQVVKSGGLGRDDLASSVKAVLDELQRLSGQVPIIYTSPDFWNSNLVDQSGEAPAWTADYPLWVRDIQSETQPALPTGWSAWSFWDYQLVQSTDSDRHNMSSLGNQTDYYLSRYNGTLANLEDFASKPHTRQALSDNIVSLWSVLDGIPLRKLQSRPPDLTALAGFAGGDFLLTGNKAGIVYYWNIEALLNTGDAQSRASAPTGSLNTLQAPVKSVVTGDAGDWWIAINDQEQAYIDHFTNLVQPTAFLDCRNAPIASPVFSPGERWLAAGTNKGVCLWRLNVQRDTNFEVNEILTAEPNFTIVVFDPSGRYLAAGGQGSTILIWDLQNSSNAPIELSMSEGEVSSLGFSDDGLMLAAGHVNGALSLWQDWSTADPGLTFVGPRGQINQLVFDPDGAWLFTASNDHHLLAWDLEIIPDPVALACNLAGRSPTQQELAAFGLDPDLIAEYVDICQ